MKKALFLLLFLCAGVTVFGQSTPPLRVQEADGSPSKNGVTKIIVSNGTLTIAGNTATLTTGGASSGANPTATIGLSAVNGSASTFLRSDGAPALSQAIAPTWTALHTHSLGSTPGNAILLASTAIGSAGTRDSHTVILQGASDNGSAHTIDWKQVVNVITNGGASNYLLQSRADAGSFTTRLTLSDGGNLNLPGSLTWGGGSTVLRVLSATASLDFGATAAGACDLLTITVTGAADGDPVFLGIPAALAASDNYQQFSGYVSAANTVTVKRCNLTNTTTALSNPAAATVRATVFQH